MDFVSPSQGWMVVIFHGGALCVTGRPYDDGEDDAVVKQVFEAFHRLDGTAAVAHIVLCLHTNDRRCRGVRVSRGDAAKPPPTREQVRSAMAGAVGALRIISVSTDRRIDVCVDDPLTCLIPAPYIRAIGDSLEELHSAGCVSIGD